MQSVAVTRCVSVTGGHADKTPWVISNFESINGVEYIPLSMRDSGFNRFVAGAGSRGICGKSGDFLTKPRELRATATMSSHVGKSESDALKQRERLPSGGSYLQPLKSKHQASSATVSRWSP